MTHKAFKFADSSYVRNKSSGCCNLFVSDMYKIYICYKHEEIKIQSIDSSSEWGWYRFDKFAEASCHKSLAPPSCAAEFIQNHIERYMKMIILK